MTYNSPKTFNIKYTFHMKTNKYFFIIINAQIEKSTDISAITCNPIFVRNTLVFDIPSNHTLSGHVVVNIFVKGRYSSELILFSSRFLLLGNRKAATRAYCSQNLSRTEVLDAFLANVPLTEHPLVYNLRKHTTYQSDNNLSSSEQKMANKLQEVCLYLFSTLVGKFIASFKIVEEEDVPIYLEELETKKLERNEYFQQLPEFDEDENADFAWRVRLEIREAINIPDSTPGVKPQVYVETGWTEFANTLPEQSRIYSSSILNTNHPQWDQTFLITNPSHVAKKPTGHIMLTVKDNHNLEDVFRIYIPLQSMVPFMAYNIKAFDDGLGATGGKENNEVNNTTGLNVVVPELYFSIQLEAPYNNKDCLHDIIVNDVSFEPAVAPFKFFALVMVVGGERDPLLEGIEGNEDDMRGGKSHLKKSGLNMNNNSRINANRSRSQYEEEEEQTYGNTSNSSPPRINFYPFNTRSDSIERILEFDQTEEFSYTMSQNMRVPPIKSTKYKAATILTVSEHLLKKQVSFYIAGKLDKNQQGLSGVGGMNPSSLMMDTDMGTGASGGNLSSSISTFHKYKVIGLAENIQKDLINLLIEKVKKRLFLPVKISNQSMKIGKCQIEIGSKEDIVASLLSEAVGGEGVGGNGSRVIANKSNVQVQALSASRFSPGEQTASERLMKDYGISSDESLYKHVSQNNEIIARMLRELDDKAESLKQAAAEISSLRSKVKLMQNENSILKLNSLKEEDELINLVQREVENMSNRDLKDKIAKISHLYKSEKLKSKELDRALKMLEPQVSNSMQLQFIIANQKNAHAQLEERVAKYKKEFERISVYKDTIKKQEKVIAKLESVMKNGMEEVRNARRYKIELEEMKRRNGGGRSDHIREEGGGRRRAEDKEEIEKLQRIISELQSEQQYGQMKGSGSSSSFSGRINKGNGDEGNSYELEFKLHQAETRIHMLEEELEEKSKSYARELAMFKMKIAEKEAVLNGFNPGSRVSGY